MAAANDTDHDYSASVEDKPDRRSYAALGTILMIVVVIVVVLLYWRTCGKTDPGVESSGGGIITAVPDLSPVSGGVALWVKPGESIDAILARNGLAETSALDMGDGTYVISIDAEDPTAIVEELKKDPGLLDAGFLYAEDGTR